MRFAGPFFLHPPGILDPIVQDLQHLGICGFRQKGEFQCVQQASLGTS